MLAERRQRRALRERVPVPQQPELGQQVSHARHPQPIDRRTGRTRARNRSARRHGWPAGRSAWWGGVAHHAGRAQRGTRHARPGHLADRRRRPGQRAPEQAEAAPGQRSASRAILGIAYLQRARETNDPSYYSKAQTLLGAVAQARSGRAGRHDRSGLARPLLPRFPRRRCDSGSARSRSRTASRRAALGMIGDASVELGRYQQGFAAFARLGELRPGLVAYARLSYSRELVGDVAGATRLMRARRRRGLGRAREHAVDARAARGAAAQVGSRRGGREGVPPRARAAARLRARRGRPGRRRGRPRQPRAGRAVVRPRGLAPAAARHRRAARRRARGARRCGRREGGLRPRPPRAGALRPLRRQRRSRDGALRGVPPGRAVARFRRRAGAQGARLPPVDLRPRFTRLGAVLGREVPPGSASGHARKPPRHDRPGALVAPRRDRRLRREARPWPAPPSRGRSRARRTSTRSTPRPRGGCWRSSDGPRMRTAKWHSRRVPLGTLRLLAVAAVALAVLVPAAEAHPLGNFTVNQYTRLDSLGRTSRCATCSTWPRSRRSSGGSSSMRTGTGASGRGEGARARSARRARLAASAAAGRREAGAARARDGARRLPQGAGRALDDAARCALPRGRARARRLRRTRCSSPTRYATDRVGWRELLVARGDGCRGALDGRRDRRSARRR